MPSFLTQCPHCLTSFRVTDTQLDAAEGLVRCGACLGVFSAVANRITLKQTPDEAAASAAAAPARAAQDEVEDLQDPAAELAVSDEEKSADADELADETVADVEPFEEELSEEEPFDEELSDEELSDELSDEELDEAPATEGFPDVEFVLPGAATRWSPAEAMSADETTDEELLERDFDIPLGDLNLDDEFDDEPLEDEQDSEEALDEDEFENEFEEEDVGEYEEEDEEEAEELEEEAFERDEALTDDDLTDDDLTDDEEIRAAVDEALAASHEDERSARLPPLARAAPTARASTDKTELRRYLADIEDDEALDPLDDTEALDELDEPVTFDTAPRRHWSVGLALFIGNLALATILLLQYADANIVELSRNARLAPLMPYVCRMVECPPPERSQLNLLVSEQLLVRSHPRYAEALEVNLVFRNDANAAQPFPALELGLHDSSDRLLANRLFKPSEYLPVELRTSDMPARSSIQVTLELEDPGSEAVNYSLVFRKPE